MICPKCKYDNRQAVDFCGMCYVPFNAAKEEAVPSYKRRFAELPPTQAVAEKKSFSPVAMLLIALTIAALVTGYGARKERAFPDALMGAFAEGMDQMMVQAAKQFEAQGYSINQHEGFSHQFKMQQRKVTAGLSLYAIGILLTLLQIIFGPLLIVAGAGCMIAGELIPYKLEFVLIPLGLFVTYQFRKNDAIAK